MGMTQTEKIHKSRPNLMVTYFIIHIIEPCYHGTVQLYLNVMLVARSFLGGQAESVTPHYILARLVYRAPDIL